MIKKGFSYAMQNLFFPFEENAPESAVEQKYIYPLLSGREYLEIRPSLIHPQAKIDGIFIGKGSEKKRYAPDHLVYASGYPVLVCEAKKPSVDVRVGFREAQLYAHQINSRYPADINPLKHVMATNGRDIVVGSWNSDQLQFSASCGDITPESQSIKELRSLVGSDALQTYAANFIKQLMPDGWELPSSKLGLNRVSMAKTGHNSLFPLLEPILRSYFDPRNKEYEDIIVEKAYVSTEERTKYEGTFESFLRERVIPTNDLRGLEINTTKHGMEKITDKLLELDKKDFGYMQLIIGGVGSGKTTFIKRLFKFSLPQSVQQNIIHFRINFNQADNNLENASDWMCNQLISDVRQKFSSILDLSNEDTLKKVFSNQISDRAGAYKFLRKSSEAEYYKRLGEDLLEWMDTPQVFAQALCQYLRRYLGKTVVVIFDNVDRRERAAQLAIFQTGHWFMNHTKTVCMMTVRDETYEIYRNQKPFDAFMKANNFYIKPPRFVDMVKKRLDLALSDRKFDESKRTSIELPGLGKIEFPESALGAFLVAIYYDLFNRRRNATIILEGLAGKNSREALEMFSALLTSAHFPVSEFTSSALSDGKGKIREHALIKSLMRTNYLFFTSNHGFVRNIFYTLTSQGSVNYSIKYEILSFLVQNRSSLGDVRLEGFFTVGHIRSQFSSTGYDDNIIRRAINELIQDELVVTDRYIVDEALDNDPIRVNAAGFIHLKILCKRLEYTASCALVTPVRGAKVAQAIADKWRIIDPRNDISRDKKKSVGDYFLDYLKTTDGIGEFSEAFRNDIEASVAFSGHAIAQSVSETAGSIKEFETKFE